LLHSGEATPLAELVARLGVGDQVNEDLAAIRDRWRSAPLRGLAEDGQM
jgi:hypothetical protein